MPADTPRGAARLRFAERDGCAEGAASGGGGVALGAGRVAAEPGGGAQGVGGAAGDAEAVVAAQESLTAAKIKTDKLNSIVGRKDSTLLYKFKWDFKTKLYKP